MHLVSSVQATINQINILKQYLMLKVNDEDWHGVADAAMDIRELKAKLDVYLVHEEMQKNISQATTGLLTLAQEGSKEFVGKEGLNHPETRRT